MRKSQKGRGRRTVDADEEPRVGHTAKIKPTLKKEISDEAPLRGHTSSEATEHIIVLGLPLYKKHFKPKYEAAR